MDTPTQLDNLKAELEALRAELNLRTMSQNTAESIRETVVIGTDPTFSENISFNILGTNYTALKGGDGVLEVSYKGHTYKIPFYV